MALGARSSTFTNGWVRQRHREQKNSKPLTVLTTTKALTKTANCTCRAIKVEGSNNIKFPALRGGRVSPTFKFVPAPLLRSATQHRAVCQRQPRFFFIRFPYAGNMCLSRKLTYLYQKQETTCSKHLPGRKLVNKSAGDLLNRPTVTAVCVQQVGCQRTIERTMEATLVLPVGEHSQRYELGKIFTL